MNPNGAIGSQTQTPMQAIVFMYHNNMAQISALISEVERLNNLNRVLAVTVCNEYNLSMPNQRAQQAAAISRGNANPAMPSHQTYGAHPTTASPTPHAFSSYPSTSSPHAYGTYATTPSQMYGSGSRPAHYDFLSASSSSSNTNADRTLNERIEEILRRQPAAAAPPPAPSSATSNNASSQLLSAIDGMLRGVLGQSGGNIQFIDIDIRDLVPNAASTASTQGLTEDEIRVYTDDAVEFGALRNPINTECPITYAAFGATDRVTRIKRCGHVFQPLAIHRWLQTRSTCPMCRSNVREEAAAAATDATNAAHQSDVSEESDTESVGYEVD